MSANFTVYRMGAAAFTIESRTQGGVRKATSAKYVSKLMNDESVSLTVLSSVTLDFRLRDYIIYKGKPYMLNQMPEVSVGSSNPNYSYHPGIPQKNVLMSSLPACPGSVLCATSPVTGKSRHPELCI